MTEKIPVAVVILNWNGKALSAACLKSWALASPAPQRILLVDNGSRDGSAAALRRQFPRLEILALKQNLGFGAGNNRGIEALLKKGKRPEAFFICNNDTEVEPDMLGKLWAALQARPTWGVAGPKILFFGSERIWFNGGMIRPFSGRTLHLDAGRDDQFGGEPFELPATGFVTGCGLLIRSSLLQALEGFEESFWAYCEDSDLCLRARGLGFASGMVPEARMRHWVSASFGINSSRGQYYGKRNSLRLIRRHRLGLGSLTRALYIFLVGSKALAGAVGSLRLDRALAVKDGVRDYFRHKTGAREAQVRNFGGWE